MTDAMRRLYLLTAAFTVAGFTWYLWHHGAREALGFLIGALGSFANLWLFNWLSGSIAPGENVRRPWQAGLFIGRYAGLILVGYATVNALDVSPLAVLLGLLASTAAALASSIIELVQSFRGN